MKDDGINDQINDYTKCILYSEFGMTIDWEEDPSESSTTLPDTSTAQSSTTTTSDNIDLIPNGVRCPANQLSDGTKIIGGTDANPHSWPWIVNVLFWQSTLNNSPYCGGSILNNRAVLTAAHCCTLRRSEYKLRIGDHSTSMTDDGEMDYDVAKVIPHPKYGPISGDFEDGYGKNYDVCILITTEPMDLDGKSRDIVCLPDQGDHVLPTGGMKEVEGNKCFVAGWGTMDNDNTNPDKLQSVKGRDLIINKVSRPFPATSIFII